MRNYKIEEEAIKWFDYANKIKNPFNKDVMKLMGQGCNESAKGNYEEASKLWKKAYWTQKKHNKKPTIIIK